MLELVEARGIRATLLVVPGRWNSVALSDDPSTVAWLRDAADRGHEVAMHGWTHEVGNDRAAAHRNVRNRFVARGCGEFVDLDQSAALARLEAGIIAMAECGFRPLGFTPPGWLASPGTVAALRTTGFAYTTSHGAVHDLVRDRHLRVPAVCQRPGSPLTAAGISVVRRFVVHRIVRHRPVRVALHPADIRSARLHDATAQLLDIAACTETTTYAELTGAEDRLTPDRLV